MIFASCLENSIRQRRGRGRQEIYRNYPLKPYVKPHDRRNPERRYGLETRAVEFVFEHRFVIEQVDDLDKRSDLGAEYPSCKPVPRVGGEEPVEPPGVIGLGRVEKTKGGFTMNK
ncbi:MAG TPA: hypothetical protein VLX68_13495 [Chitinivibrionales bacterium]|nr:hypothetical protein [Chitinivibrionales bacterium]